MDEEIRNTQRFLSNSPEGALVSRKKPDGSYSYYRSFKNSEGKKKEIYLRKDDEKIAKSLAAKEYSSIRLKDAIREKRIIDEMISFAQNEKDADRYLRLHPGAAELVIPMLTQTTSFAEQWANYPYVRSNNHPENLIFTTVIPDLRVRSKAEADIVGRYVHFGIPFRFEEENIINGIAYHPDFTCLNVETNQIFYWEHQGRWDDSKYVSRLQKRNLEYQKIGVIPWKNLIITTETENQPLDIQWIDNLILYYLKK